MLADDDYAEYPWNTMGPGPGPGCTGTMIGATTLVTAGHCVVTPLGSCPDPSTWMQRESLDDNDLFELSLRHDGYPSCSDEGAPSPCSNNWHFEVLPCSADTDPNAAIVEDSLDTTVWSDAITSPGHSGGPLWYINENQQAKLVGTAIGGTYGEPDSLFRRFTPTSLSQLSTWICVATSCT